MLIDTVRRFLDHHLMDWGAALTFYAGISLIPALVIVIASLGLVGDPALDDLTQNLSQRDDGPGGRCRWRSPRRRSSRSREPRWSS